MSAKAGLRHLPHTVKGWPPVGIAGCTEIELLIAPDDLTVPYFPTARLHAEAAANQALALPV